MPARSRGFPCVAVEAGAEVGPESRLFIPLRMGNSFPTSGITLRGRPLNPTSNDGTLGSDNGLVLFNNGRFGRGFIAWGDVKYETSCRHLEYACLVERKISMHSYILLKIISTSRSALGITPRWWLAQSPNVTWSWPIGRPIRPCRPCLSFLCGS